MKRPCLELAIMIVVLCTAVGIVAQQTAHPVSSPGTTVIPANIPFPQEYKGPIRDYEYEINQLDIDDANMLLKIEQNKARKKELWEAVRTVATNFAISKKIDTNTVDLDPKNVQFIPKKK